MRPPSITTTRSKPRPGPLPALALLLATVASGCNAPPHAAENLVLIVVDTLRADHLSSYGYRRITTPAIDAFAARAIRFDRAYATASWTKPSVASMLTGRYPRGHGLVGINQVLSESVQTLAEILRDAGFRSEGVISHSLLSRRHGFAQGFDRYSETSIMGEATVSTPSVIDDAMARLRVLARRDEPFFLFVHLFDPHYNYVRHPEIGYAAPSSGRLDGDEDIHDLRGMLEELSDEELSFLRDLYDEEIRFTDRGIGRLLEEISRLGLDDETAIVVTADHGEEFRERDWLGHTRSLNEEIIRVPLVIRTPASRARPAVVERPVSLVSLTPTLLELVGLEGAQHDFDGPSLARLWQNPGEASESSNYVYSEVTFVPYGSDDAMKHSLRRAVIGSRFKLILDELAGRAVVFDLQRDPGEREDLAGDTALLRGLAGIMDRYAAFVSRRTATTRSRELDPQEIEQLRRLGYIGPEESKAPEP